MLYYSKDELKYPQEKNNGSIISLDDLNEKEINNPKSQAMCLKEVDIIIHLFS